jgi:hypothetical protein
MLIHFAPGRPTILIGAGFVEGDNACRETSVIKPSLNNKARLRSPVRLDRGTVEVEGCDSSLRRYTFQGLQKCQNADIPIEET